MALDLTSVTPIYQENIDALINQLGKNVRLVFEDTVTNVDTNFSDVVREGDIRKPSFEIEANQSAPTVVKNEKIIKALVKHNPSDFKNFGIQVKEGSSVVRLKTFLTDVPDLLRCKHIIPNSDISGVIDAKFRLLREPIPQGLQIDRYAVTYWERV